MASLKKKPIYKEEQTDLIKTVNKIKAEEKKAKKKAEKKVVITNDPTATSFMLKKDDIIKLNNCATKVNELTRSHITKTQVVRALIDITDKYTPEKILKIIKKQL